MNVNCSQDEQKLLVCWHWAGIRLKDACAPFPEAHTVRTMVSPIIFTHYGNIDYLSRTLAAARLSNPEARLILIGDASNKDTALGRGWEHVDIDSQSSPLRDVFGRRFREVQGNRHNAYKGGRNWLRYVFERWFVVAAFIETERIGTFWHFDSDVMIVTPLAPFEDMLRAEDIEFTRQCNDACLNGFVTATVVHDFCQFMLGLFEDDALLAHYQQQYDTVHPGHAFTEMTAFRLYSDVSTRRGFHLEAHFPGWWFDDALAQDDGFETTRMGWLGPSAKQVTFDGVHFSGRRDSHILNFASINGSWLPISLFDWILSCLANPIAERRRTLRDVSPGLVAELRGLRKALKGNRS